MSYDTTVVIHLDYTIEDEQDLQALQLYVEERLRVVHLDCKRLHAECVDVFVETPL